MEYMCVRTCTIRYNGRSVFIEKNQILELDEDPGQNFARVGDIEIDFSRATLEMLLRSKTWLTKDAIEYIEVDLDHELNGPPMTRKEIAQVLVDTRDRRVTLPNEV